MNWDTCVDLCCLSYSETQKFAGKDNPLNWSFLDKLFKWTKWHLCFPLLGCHLCPLYTDKCSVLSSLAFLRGCRARSYRKRASVPCGQGARSELLSVTDEVLRGNHAASSLSHPSPSTLITLRDISQALDLFPPPLPIFLPTPTYPAHQPRHHFLQDTRPDPTQRLQ